MKTSTQLKKEIEALKQKAESLENRELAIVSELEELHKEYPYGIKIDYLQGYIIANKSWSEEMANFLIRTGFKPYWNDDELGYKSNWYYGGRETDYASSWVIFKTKEELLEYLRSKK